MIHKLSSCSNIKWFFTLNNIILQWGEDVCALKWRQAESSADGLGIEATKHWKTRRHHLSLGKHFQGRLMPMSWAVGSHPQWENLLSHLVPTHFLSMKPEHWIYYQYNELFHLITDLDLLLHLLSNYSISCICELVLIHNLTFAFRPHATEEQECYPVLYLESHMHLDS